MDQLLKQAPRALEDERAALFGLTDRFMASVEAYRKEYKAVADSKDADLRKRETDGKNTLQRLENSQASQRKASLDQLNALTSRITQESDSVKKEAADRLGKLEADAAEYERKERLELEEVYSDGQYQIDDYKDLRGKVRDVFNRTDHYLGPSLTGKSKVEQILENQPVSGKVKDADEARKLLVYDSFVYADRIMQEIENISQSLPSKVIFHYKRNKLVRELAELDDRMEKAQKLLEREFVDRYKKLQADSQKRCQSYRSASNNRKEAVINQRDRRLASQREELQRANEEYQKTIAGMKQLHAEKYREQAEHCAKQLAAARNNWDARLAQCSAGFVKQMEEEYPAARFNAWMKQFWAHPRTVEDYGKLQDTQMNMLMGAASVDISDWYQGGPARAIKKVLTRYPWLFGTNREAASKAYFQGKWLLPYCISIENGDSVLLSYDDSGEERAKAMVNALGMRLLRSVPAGMMRFLLFDADGIGAFGRLMALDPANANNPSEPVVRSIAIGEGGKVHSTDIPKQIGETKILMDDLSRQLANDTSLREFNARNPLSRQIYRPILMMNFPSGLAEGEIRMLNAMTVNCRKWGFSMVLAQPDREQKAARPELKRFLDELYRGLICLRMENNEKFLRVIHPASQTEKLAQIGLYGLPPAAAMAEIAAEIRERSLNASSVKIHFAQAKGICPEAGQRYTQRSDDGLVVPVGYLEGGQPFRLPFDDKHVHTMIMGNIGSGKTNLLHVIMTNLMLRYDPSEVMLYLIDFKYGLDFRIYTRYNLPNFRSISVTDDPEFALAMLEQLEGQLKERSDQMGSRYQKISDYNADHPGSRMNRIVLIVDELYELVKRAPDDVQKKIIQKIDSFAHQTRAFGLHMVICGQDLDKIGNFETIKNQCINRLALHCEDEQVKLLISEEGAARMHTIDAVDQGACVFSLAGGKNPQIEHTALLTTRQQEQFLREIQEHYLAQKRITNVKVLLTKVSDNPNHCIQMFVDRGFLPDADHSRLYVGDPISLERELLFRPQQNVWIAGGGGGEESSRAANSLLLFALISLTMEKLKERKTEILCTNIPDAPMRSAEAEEEDRFGQLASNFPALCQYSVGRQFPDVLNRLLDELDARKNGARPSDRIIWWFLAAPELGFSLRGGGSDIIDLKELLRTGPRYGIRTVLWTGSVKRAQVLQLDRTLFGERVCLEMTPEESKLVNGEELNPPPAGYRAVLIGQNAVRFRVYDLPDGKWMSLLFERLRKSL